MRVIAGAAIGIIVSAVLSVQPAHATATDRGTAGSSDAVVVTHGSLTTDSSMKADCYEVVSFYGHVGHKICGTLDSWVFFSDGHVRAFLIGTDHAVWNIVRYPNGSVSGWRSLNGWLQGGVDFDYANAPYDLQIFSIGGDGGYWCNRLSNSWSGWFKC